MDRPLVAPFGFADEMLTVPLIYPKPNASGEPRFELANAGLVFERAPMYCLSTTTNHQSVWLSFGALVRRLAITPNLVIRDDEPLMLHKPIHYRMVQLNLTTQMFL